MSRMGHLSNGKSIMILGTVVGCLSLLWPKVFYPMIQGGFQTVNSDANIKGKIHPRMKAAKTMPKQYQSNFYGPSPHYPQNEQSSVGGASIGLIMTVYTVGIILLFIYTIFKHVSSDGSLDSIDELDKGQFNRNRDKEPKPKKGKASFNEYNHEQGECLKGLAMNYVRCKQKLDPKVKNEATTDDDEVSMAYRVLLGDMLELRDYLVELQCSASCCGPECLEDHSEIIYNQEVDEALRKPKPTECCETLDCDGDSDTFLEVDETQPNEFQREQDDLNENSNEIFQKIIKTSNFEDQTSQTSGSSDDEIEE